MEQYESLERTSEKLATPKAKWSTTRVSNDAVVREPKFPQISKSSSIPNPLLPRY